MIISKLHFFQIQGKFLHRDSMMFNQPFFSIAPETLQAINVYFPGGEDLLVIDSEMTITTEHQSIISSESIGIDYASPTHLFNCKTQKGISTNIRHNLHLNYPLPLQDAENRDFVTSTTSTLTLSLTSEISLVHLYLSTDQTITSFPLYYYTLPDKIYCLKYSRITYIDLFGDLPGRKPQLKQFDYPEPVDCTYPQLAQPPTSPLGKSITTPLTAKTTIQKSIDSIALTPCAKTTAIFTQPPHQKTPGCIFSLNNKLKRLYVHLHQYNLVPNVLQSPNKKPRFFKRGSSMRLNHLLQFNYIYCLGSFGTLCGIETNSVSLIQTLVALCLNG